jgi:hypothetical protein
MKAQTCDDGGTNTGAVQEGPKSCHNKGPQVDRLSKGKLFSHNLELEIWSRYQCGWFLSRTLCMHCRWPPPCYFSHGLSLVFTNGAWRERERERWRAPSSLLTTLLDQCSVFHPMTSRNLNYSLGGLIATYCQNGCHGLAHEWGALTFSPYTAHLILVLYSSIPVPGTCQSLPLRGRHYLCLLEAYRMLCILLSRVDKQ